MKNLLKVLVNNLKNGVNLGKGFIKSFLLLLTVLLVIIYYQTEIYDFEEPKNDLQADFFNPYSNWNLQKTVKANFHAHSKSWFGLTNGKNSEHEIKENYEKLGYAVAAISNYHKIEGKTNGSIINIPCFEHGYNTDKAHLLAINALETSNLDFPFFQGTSQKQSRIYELRKSASLVAIAHPSLRNGFTSNDLKYLKGYQLFEVLNPYAESFELWDYALKNGNLSWLLANDDTHDLLRQPAGRFFNMISVSKKNKNRIIQSLANGNHVAYASSLGVTDVFLQKIQVKGTTLKYEFTGNIARVNMVKNGGKIKIEPKGELNLMKDDSYVRFEVIGKKSSLYTNPIYRISNPKLAHYNFLLPVNRVKTFNYRMGCLTIALLVFILLFFRKTTTVFKNAAANN